MATLRQLLVFTPLLIIFSNFRSFGQSPDAIVGTWQTGHGSGRIEIVKSGSTYEGMLVWVKKDVDDAGQPLRDINNPDPALRNREILGLPVLSGFRYSGDGEWEGGSVYDPRTGKFYSGKLTVAGADKLNVRAFIGISLVGKTQVWTKLR